MDESLNKIRQAYDMVVEQHEKGIDPMSNVPLSIKNSPGYKYISENKEKLNSAAPDIKEYLNPGPGMRYLDGGCSANLANCRLDRWPSTYYGVDISPRLIEAMKGFVIRNGISIGGLYVADLSELRFDDDFFDIATVIGVFEYCPLSYIIKALKELYRVLKPGARMALDIPNQNHPYINDMIRLEEYLERPMILHPAPDVEELLTRFFTIDNTDDSQIMIKYFMQTPK